MMSFLKGIPISMGGPTPRYDMQRILASRTARDAALMSGIVYICLIPRWIMIGGITVLALVYVRPMMNEGMDFEQILPYVINTYIPVGLKGLLLAGLIAAFMSTFDSTVNAGAAYLVNDVYKRYVRPGVSEASYVRTGNMASVLLVLLGIVFGRMAGSIDAVTRWIVAALWGGYAAPNMLKSYWWRFNGYGYFVGMMLGIGGALLIPLIVEDRPALYLSPYILLVSVEGCVVGILLTKPEEFSVLKKLYMQVRPCGLWKPVHQKVLQEHPNFQTRASFLRDASNVVVGVVWLMMLCVIPMSLMIREYALMLEAPAFWS